MDQLRLCRRSRAVVTPLAVLFFEASQLVKRLRGDEKNQGEHDLLIAGIVLGEAEGLVNPSSSPKS